VSEPVVVTATRQDGWWSVRADVPHAVVWTQTKRLDQVEEVSREAIALALDVPASTIAVEVEYDIPGDLLDLVTAAHTMGVTANQMQTIATRMNHVVASELRDRGFSVRDIAMMMGFSAQRVSQLLAHRSPVRGTSRSKPTRSVVAKESAADLIAEFTESVSTAVRTLKSTLRRLSVSGGSQ
jgi:predicted transcriptional regulator